MNPGTRQLHARTHYVFFPSLDSGVLGIAARHAARCSPSKWGDQKQIRCAEEWGAMAYALGWEQYSDQQGTVEYSLGVGQWECVYQLYLITCIEISGRHQEITSELEA